MYNYKLVEAWSKKFGVEVIALNAPNRSVPAGVTLSTFQDYRKASAAWRFVRWRRNLLAEIKKHPTDTTIVTTSATNAVLKDARTEGYETVAVVQAYEDFGFSTPGGKLIDRLRGSKRLLATGQGLRGYLDRAETVIVNSDYMETIVGAVFGRGLKTYRLYPPLTLPIRTKIVFSRESLTSVGFVNRSGKNLEFVIVLAASMPAVRFLVFGHETEELKNLPKNVIFRGWMANKEEMYAEAYTWMVPSYWEEPFGLVAIEALSQGCRVAVSSRGGLPEAVGTHGRVFCDFDIAEWHTWIISGDFKPYQEMSRSCFSHLDRFSVENFKRRALDFFG